MNFLHASLAAAIFLGMAAPSGGAPLSLQDCLNRAQAGNPALKSAAWDTRVAQEATRVATAATLPRVDAQAGYTMQLEPQAVKIGGATAETQEPNFAFAGIAATYTLYDFGRRDARIQQASAFTGAAAENFKSGSGDVALQVIETYFRILEAGRLITAANEEIAQIGEHRRTAQVLFEEGVVTRNDVLQAEVRLASARQKLLTLTNQRDNSWLRLNFLTGTDAAFRGELDETAAETGGTEAADASAPSPAGRHDIAAQKRLLEARESEVREQLESYLPEIYTRVAMDYVQNDKVREQAIFSATLGLRVTLFDGSAAQAAREKAVSQRSKQQDTIRLLEQQALLEISTARNDARVARERIAVSEAAIKQSEENLRINRERYQERVGIASEVLDAQALAAQAKAEYYRSLYDYRTATARLRHARGEL